MADFDIVAALQLQGPSGLGSVRNQIQQGLKGINANVDITYSQGAIANTNQLNTGLGTLNTTLKQVSVSARDAAAGIVALNQAIASGRGNASSFSNSFNQISKAASNSQAGLKGATQDIQNFGYQAGLSGRRLAAFAVGATGLITFVNAIRSGFSEAIKFQGEMVRIGQVSGDTNDKIAILQNRITQLSTNLGVSSRELAQSATTLRQAGQTIAEVNRNLEAVALADLAPNFRDQKQVVEGLIATFAQFKNSVKDPVAILGSLNAVAGQFAVEASDLVTVIQRAGGAFASAGGNLDELLGLFTSVRATTRESAESISTSLRTIFSRLQSNDTVEALKDLRINLRFTREEAARANDLGLENQFVGAYEAVRRLSDGLAGLRTTDPRYAQIVDEIGGKRNVSKIIPLIREQALAQQAYNVAQAGGTSLAISAKKAQESLSVQLTKTRENYQALFNAITTDDGFLTLAKSALTAANAFAKVIDSIRPLIPVLAAVGIAKVAAFAIPQVGAFSTGLLSGGRKFATGGHVPGSGSGDIVPAMLEPGEFVFTKQAVRNSGGVAQMRALHDDLKNRGNVQRFARGGAVGYANGDVIKPEDQYSVLPTSKFSGNPLFAVIEKKAAQLGLALDGTTKVMVDFSGGGGPALKGFVDTVRRVTISLEGAVTNLSSPAKSSTSGPRQSKFLPEAEVQALIAEHKDLPLKVGERLYAQRKVSSPDEVASPGGRGLERAAYDFNPEGGASFETFARKYIVQEYGNYRKKSVNQRSSSAQSIYAVGDDGIETEIDSEGRTGGRSLGARRQAANSGAKGGILDKIIRRESSDEAAQELKRLAESKPGELETDEVVARRRLREGKKNSEEYAAIQAERVAQEATKQSTTPVSSGLSLGDRLRAKRAGTLTQETPVVSTPAVQATIEQAVASQVEQSVLEVKQQVVEATEKAVKTKKPVSSGTRPPRKPPTNVAAATPDDSGDSINQRINEREVGYFQREAERRKSPYKLRSGTTERPAFDINAFTGGSRLRAYRDEQPPIVPYGLASEQPKFIGPKPLLTTYSAANQRRPVTGYNPAGVDAEIAGITGGDYQAQIRARRLQERGVTSEGEIYRGAYGLVKQNTRSNFHTQFNDRVEQRGTGYFANEARRRAFLNEERPVLGPPRPTESQLADTRYQNTLNRVNIIDAAGRGNQTAFDKTSRIANQRPGLSEASLARIAKEFDRPKVGAAGTFDARFNEKVSERTPGYFAQLALEKRLRDAEIERNRAYTRVVTEGPNFIGPTLTRQRPTSVSNLPPDVVEYQDEVLRQNVRNQAISFRNREINPSLARGAESEQQVRGNYAAYNRQTRGRNLSPEAQQRIAQGVSTATATIDPLAARQARLRQIEEARTPVLTYDETGTPYFVNQNSPLNLSPTGALRELRATAPRVVAPPVYGPPRPPVVEPPVYGPSRPSRFQQFGNRVTRFSERVSGANLDPSTRGYRNYGIGIAATVGATAASYGFDYLAGDANAAVANDRRGQYVGNRTAGGAVTGAIGGATSGAFIGGAIGSVIPVLGTSVGAVVGGGIGAVGGGLAGGVYGNVDARNDVAQVKINNSINTFNEKLSTLGKTNGLNTAGSLLETREALSAYLKDTKEKNTAGATGLLGGFNSTTFSDLQARSLRQDLGTQLPQIMEALGKQAAALGKDSPNESVGNLTKRLTEGGNGLNKELLNIVAKIRGVSVDKALEDFAKTIELSASEVRLQSQQLARRGQEERAINSFARLASSVAAAADSLKTFEARSQALGDLFAGVVGGSKLSANSEQLNNLGRLDRSALEPIGVAASIGGIEGQKLLGAGKAIDDIARVLPGVLSQVSSKAPTEGQDFVTATRAGILQGLNLKPSQVSPELSGILASVVRQLEDATKNGPGQAIDEFGLDPSKFVDKLIASAGEALVRSVTEINKNFEQASNEFVSGLIDLSKRFSTIREGLGQLDSLQLNSARTNAQFATDRFGGHATDLLSLQQLQAPYQLRQERLTQLSGGNATNPELLASLLAKANGDVLAGEEAQKKAFQNPGQDGQNFRQAAESLVILKDRATNYRQALENLTKVTERAAGPLEKLGRIQQEKEGRLGFAERFYGSDAEGRNRINRGLYLANAANNEGNLDKFQPQDQQLILETLRSLGPSTLTGFNGKPQADVLTRRLLENSGGGVFRLNAGQQQEALGLQGQVQGINADAEKARAALNDNAGTLNQELFTGLRTIQEAFFSRLEQFLVRDKVAAAQTDVAQLSIKQGSLGKLSTQRQNLAQFGITSPEQVKSLVENKAILEALSPATKTVRDTESLGFKLFTQSKKDSDSGNLPQLPILGRSQKAEGEFIEEYLSRSQFDKVDGPSKDRLRQNLQTGFDNRGRAARENPGITTKEFASQVLQLAIAKEFLAGGTGTGIGDARNTLAEAQGKVKGIGLQGVNTDALSKTLIDSPQSILQSLEKLNDYIIQNPGQSFQALDAEIRDTTESLEKFKTFINGFQANGGVPAAPGLANGGSVFKARGTDTVPAMLTPNEFVVNAKSAKANSSLLTRINNAKGPVYLADGGIAASEFRNGKNPHITTYRKNPKSEYLNGRAYTNIPLGPSGEAASERKPYSEYLNGKNPTITPFGQRGKYSEYLNGKTSSVIPYGSENIRSEYLNGKAYTNVPLGPSGAGKTAEQLYSEFRNGKKPRIVPDGQIDKKSEYLNGKNPVLTPNGNLGPKSEFRNGKNPRIVPFGYKEPEFGKGVRLPRGLKVKPVSEDANIGSISPVTMFLASALLSQVPHPTIIKPKPKSDLEILFGYNGAKQVLEFEAKKKRELEAKTTSTNQSSDGFAGFAEASLTGSGIKKRLQEAGLVPTPNISSGSSGYIGKGSVAENLLQYVGLVPKPSQPQTFSQYKTQSGSADGGFSTIQKLVRQNKAKERTSQLKSIRDDAARIEYLKSTGGLQSDEQRERSSQVDQYARNTLAGYITSGPIDTRTQEERDRYVDIGRSDTDVRRKIQTAFGGYPTTKGFRDSDIAKYSQEERNYALSLKPGSKIAEGGAAFRANPARQKALKNDTTFLNKVRQQRLNEENAEELFRQAKYKKTSQSTGFKFSPGARATGLPKKKLAGKGSGGLTSGIPYGGQAALTLAGPNAGILAQQVAYENLRRRQQLASVEDVGANFGFGKADYQTQNRSYVDSLGRQQSYNEFSARNNGAVNDYYRGRVSPQLIPSFGQATHNSRFKTKPYHYADGGFVGGTGHKDDIPAVLMAGEYVLKQSATARIGKSNLDKMNHFADGGIVGAAPVTSSSSAQAFPQNAIQALHGFNEASRGLANTFTLFSQSTATLTQSFNLFNGNSAALADALNKMPRTMTGQFTHQVNMTLNGAEMLAKLSPEIKSMVEQNIKSTLSNIFKTQLPDAGIKVE